MKKEEEKVKAEEEIFHFDVNQRYNEIQAKMERTRRIAMENSKHVKVPEPKDPLEKLKRRLETYHNIRKMKTDCKNYIRKYGEPPSEISRKIFQLG